MKFTVSVLCYDYLVKKVFYQLETTIGNIMVFFIYYASLLMLQIRTDRQNN